LFTFVGPLVEERSESLKDPFIELLKDFPEMENKSINSNPKKLIYVSCGTVFNNNVSIFKKIVDAFIGFDEYLKSTSSLFSSKDLSIVISAGPSVVEAFANLKKEKCFRMTNILLVGFAPQLAILKRASLFITHCGMNSTSEAVHYGGNGRVSSTNIITLE